MTDSRLFILSHPEARTRAIQAVTAAPSGWVVKVSPPGRSLDQNAALHALLSDIAARREWVGKKWDVTFWKRLLTAAWCRATAQSAIVVPALDGAGVDIVYRHTSKLTKAECSELIEFIHAWDAMT